MLVVDLLPTLYDLMRKRLAFYSFMFRPAAASHIIHWQYVGCIFEHPTQYKVGTPHLHPQTSLHPSMENPHLLPKSLDNTSNRPIGLTVSHNRVLKDGESLPATFELLLHAPQRKALQRI